MQLKSVCFVKIYISSCCVDTYLNSSRTDSKEKRCRAEADPSPRPSRGEGGWSLRSLDPPEVFPPGAFWECGGPVSVALSWSGLQGACIYPSPRPSRGEGGWSLRSDVATGGCCFRAFCCRASVVCGSSFLPAVCRWAGGLRAGPCGGSRLSVPARPVFVIH